MTMKVTIRLSILFEHKLRKSLLNTAWMVLMKILFDLCGNMTCRIKKSLQFLVLDLRFRFMTVYSKESWCDDSCLKRWLPLS